MARPRRKLLEEAKRAYEHGLGGAPRCQLVNPLCPDDLCILPHGHSGWEEGWHVLGTDPYDDPHQYVYPNSAMYVRDGILKPVRDEELYRLGRERAQALGIT